MSDLPKTAPPGRQSLIERVIDVLRESERGRDSDVLQLIAELVEPSEKPRLQSEVVTPEMIAAGMKAIDDYYDGTKDAPFEGSVEAFYRAMRAAAPVQALPDKQDFGTFQSRVDDFVVACFGEEVARDLVERNHRFLEEALELVQATGCPVEDARALVEYVYGRPKGEAHQETGGVLVTLAALCSAALENMAKCGEDELARVWTKIEVIREKQKAKPRGSPLPQAVTRKCLRALTDGRCSAPHCMCPVEAADSQLAASSAIGRIQCRGCEGRDRELCLDKNVCVRSAAL